MQGVRKSIKTLFILSIVLLTTLLLALQTGMNVYQFKSGMQAQVKETLSAKAGEVSSQLNQRILQIAEKTGGLALSISQMKTYDMEQAFGVADGFIKSDSLICGSGIWFEPNVYQGMPYYGPYHYRDKDGSIKLTMDYSNADYNYPSFEWYKNGISQPGRVVWTGPYLDDVSKITMLTSACAMTKNGTPAGVVTVDIGITELEKYIEDIKIGEQGYAFLVSQDGFYIATKDTDKNMKKKITEESDPALSNLGKKVIETKELTMVEDKSLGKDSYIMISPLCFENMKLVLVAPKAEYNAVIYRSIYLSIFMAVMVIVILCLAMIKIFNRKVGRPIQYLMQEASKISEGDLTSQMEIVSEDEMGSLAKALQHMSDNLRRVIGEVNAMAEQVAAASEELFASAEQSSSMATQVTQSVEQMAAGGRKQKAHTDEVAGIMKEMSDGMQESNQNAQGMMDRAEVTVEAAKNGRLSAEEAVVQMEHIEQRINETEKAILGLGDQSKEIGQIVDTIAGIAGQTNLLALNAAIEAARAGEHGRGFAVVAEEVRKLAEQSQSAAERISELIGQVQTRTEAAVDEMQNGTAEVKKGTDIVSQVGTSFRDISAHIEQVTADIRKVSDEIQGMARGSQQIVDSVHNLEQIGTQTLEESGKVSSATQTQLASQEDISSASKNLAELAQNLQNAMTRFKL